jgi:hypothetical protein
LLNVGDSALQLVGVLGADGNESGGAQDAVARGEVGFLWMSRAARSVRTLDQFSVTATGP